MFVKFKPLTKISFKNKRLLIKHLLSFCLFRIYPKSVAFFINLIPCFSRRHIFLRSNCDHFGSWTHVFMAYAYLKSIRGNINLFVFARKDTINKGWLNYINQLPIKIIYNKYLQLLISPLFHSKFSLDVNGHIILANNSQLFRNIPRLPTFTESKITDFSQYLLNNLFKDKCSLEISELKNPYILFYARSGEWIHSVKNSRRNMPKDLGILILKNIISMGFKVVLIGDTPKEYLIDTSNFFHVKKFSSDQLCSIYSNATAVIGSGSGAIHFPSFIFNLPTLSFTCKPLYHLDAMYMPPLSDSPFSEKIPFKDKWIIASDLSSKKLMKDTKVLIEYFLSKQNLKNISGDLKNPFKYIYTNINSKKSRFLSRSKRPNILIY